MKFNNIKNKLNSKYSTRIIAGFLAVVLVASGVGMYSYANEVQKDSSEDTEESTEEEVLTKILTNQVSSNSENAGKEETVYVVADATGNTEKVIVSDWLKNSNGANEITDATDLTDIENVKGEETYTEGKDGEIIWQANGKDIYYQGTTTKELPIDMNITYSLDGKTISPEELAGKSGKVTIRMDYTNKEKVEDVSVPFTVISGMVLSDKFSNVEVTNGKVISDGKNQIVVGIAMPGLRESLNLDNKDFDKEIVMPEYIEVTADVTDFSLEMTMSLIMSDVISDLDVDYDMAEIEDAIDSLSDASNQLVDGSDKLSKGVGTLEEKSETLASGVTSLTKGINSVTQAFDGENGINAGANAISDGVQQLDNTLRTKVTDEERAVITQMVAEQFAAGGENSKNAQIAAGVESQLKAAASDSVNQALTDSFYQVIYQTIYAQAIQGGADADTANQVATSTATAQIGQMSGTIATMTDQIVGGIASNAGSAVASSCADAYTEGMVSGIDYAKESVATQIENGGLVSGASALSTGINKLYEEGLVPIESGANQLYNSIPQLTKGINDLNIGAKDLSEGMVTFDKEGIQKLTDTYNGDVRDLLKRVDAVVEAGKSYKTFTKVADGTEGKVKFIIRTEAVKAE